MEVKRDKVGQGLSQKIDCDSLMGLFILGKNRKRERMWVNNNPRYNRRMGTGPLRCDQLKSLSGFIQLKNGDMIAHSRQNTFSLTTTTCK